MLFFCFVSPEIKCGLTWDEFFFFVLGKVWMATPLVMGVRRQGKGEEDGGWRRGRVERGFIYLFIFKIFRMTKTKIIYNYRN